MTRVTTVRKLWGDGIEQIAYGFDKEAAIVYLARMCMHKALVEEQKNLRQWLDSNLCRWAACFAKFIQNDQASFSLPPAMRQFPQLVYHLRRSHFVNRFGCSLDESYYFMNLLGR